jgi:hypothetical protein
MKTKHLYLLFAIIGLIIPYYFFISFLFAHSFDARAFLQQLFANNISTFFAVDLIISSVVFLLFIRHEGSQRGMAHLWVYVLALLTAGLSFAFPLFLYVRESHPPVRR